MIGFRLEGVDGVERALAKMTSAVPMAAREALSEGAAVIERNIRDRAPRRSGALADSVTSVGPSGSSISMRGMSVEIGPTTPYGRRIELGFHGADSLGRVYDQEGRPYVEPGVEASLEEVAVVVERAYESVIEAASAGF